MPADLPAGKQAPARAQPAVPLHRYAVFLRGVNVGGVTVRMAELRDLLAGLPVADVATVLASGNVTCSSALGPLDLKRTVEEALGARFGYTAWVIVTERAELGAIAASVPQPPGGAGPVHTYVTLFTGTDELAAFLREAHELQPVVLDGGTAIGWFAPKGRSTDVPLARLLARARFAATSTTRNINTVEKVLRLLG
ncbi:DUF1697 domain-containing protein [Arthrobacter agilis]|uniref:DUF1697 domain-containing protein n=1 Tax=Arthrobacter agilis TaxID=37921 RepID=UPI002788D98B|nr:DUF1697 domain-containing protein [Arthrobacter agilis]MDQ0735263.1 uncharacterized protein (DUF1697 family) [Arthrobacter agilis]